MMKNRNTLYDRVRQILESARSTVARSVNSTQVVTNWLVGREIVEEEQHGKKRAAYGESLIRNLSSKLQVDYGSGYSLANVKYFRKFYLEYPRLSGGEKGYAVRSLLPAKQSWVPGQLNPNLSWTHYRTLLRVDKPEARAFYEIEAVKNNWAARELERQICSLLYERLALIVVGQVQSNWSSILMTGKRACLMRRTTLQSCCRAVSPSINRSRKST